MGPNHALGDVVARHLEGAIERRLGIVDAVATASGADALLVKFFVVGNERQSLAEVFKVVPDDVPRWRVLGVDATDAVYMLGEVAEVVLGLGFDEAIETVDNPAVDNLDGTDRADAGGVVVGGLDVDCYK